MISMYRAKPASPEGAEGHHHLQTVSPRLLSGVFKSIAVLHTHYKHLLKAPTTLRWCTMEFPGWQMTMWPQFYGPLMMILFPRDHLCEVFIFSYYINPAFFINTPSYYTPLWTWKNLEFLIGNCRAWKLAKKKKWHFRFSFGHRMSFTLTSADHSSLVFKKKKDSRFQQENRFPHAFFVKRYGVVILTLLSTSPFEECIKMEHTERLLEP